MSVPEKILIVPAVQKHAGSGHLFRCFNLLETLGNRAYLYIPDEPKGFKDDIVRRFRKEHLSARVVSSLAAHSWDLLVLDRMKTDLEEYRIFEQAGPCICVDEGGSARQYAAFTLDTLPLPARYGAANRAGRAYLDLPAKKREGRFDFNRVLVSFGGEDPAGLTERLCRLIVDRQLFPARNITVVKGPLFTSCEVHDGIHIVNGPVDLKALLPSFDLVFTSFGLTAYEAVAIGVPVILLEPTKYHASLGKLEGFPEIGMQRPNFRRLRRFLQQPHLLFCARDAIAPKERGSIAEAILSLDGSGFMPCPVCSARVNPAVARFPEKTYFRCSSCGIIYMNNFSRRKTEYGIDYFFSEYRKQYGKTYLEDFDVIRAFSRSRLREIRNLIGEKNAKIFDIGCAYGPFLYEARQNGFIPYGMDISSEAAAHVKALGIPVLCGDFTEADIRGCFSIDAFDILTMWFVIEHFRQLVPVLTKVNRLLVRGGLFAFSTPNLTGISGRKDRSGFLTASPADHFTVWNPAAAKGILSRFGFEVVRTRITGHHPERFPGMNRPLPNVVKRICFFVSEIFALGDTFEIYARKVRDI